MATIAYTALTLVSDVKREDLAATLVAENTAGRRIVPVDATVGKRVEFSGDGLYSFVTGTITGEDTSTYVNTVDLGVPAADVNDALAAAVVAGKELTQVLRQTDGAGVVTYYDLIYTVAANS